MTLICPLSTLVTAAPATAAAGVGLGDHAGLGQVRGAQHGLDVPCPAGRVVAPPTPLEHRADLRDGHFAADAGSGALASSATASGPTSVSGAQAASAADKYSRKAPEVAIFCVSGVPRS